MSPSRSCSFGATAQEVHKSTEEGNEKFGKFDCQKAGRLQDFEMRVPKQDWSLPAKRTQGTTPLPQLRAGVNPPHARSSEKARVEHNKKQNARKEDWHGRKTNSQVCTEKQTEITTREPAAGTKMGDSAPQDAVRHLQLQLLQKSTHIPDNVVIPNCVS